MMLSWRQRRMRRRCLMIALSVPMPDPFDVSALCATLGRQRGRPIHLMPAALTDGLSGLWISTEHADYLVFEQATSPVHQEHIILHELGHLLCRHEGITSSSGGTRLARAGSPRRSCRYSVNDEVEAELVASLLRNRSGGSAATADAPTGAPAANPCGALARLENALLHGR